MRVLKFAVAASLFMMALPGQSVDEWPAYGRDAGGQRYSPLTAINRQNVAGLKVAWTFRTGDAYQPPARAAPRPSKPRPSMSTGRFTSERRSAASSRSIP